jgi:ADP-ribose pyrophosphatase
VSPGGSNEFLTLYIAKVDASGAGGTHGLTEEGEDIRVQAYTSEAAFALLDNGLVNNALTIIALQWLRIHKEQLLTQWR